MTKKLLSGFLFMALLTACGGKESFHVDVDVPAIGTQEITVVYQTESNDRVVARYPAIDGRFDFDGACGDTTEVELFNAKKQFLASFGAVNGMKINLRAEGDSLFIEGGVKPVRRKFDDAPAVDRPEFKGAELVIRHDSVATFPVRGLWFFTSSTMERTPAVLDSMRKYAKIDTIPVRDVYVSADLSQWRLYTNRDSATWTQGLMPEAPLVFKGILTSTPCFVEVDSAGVVKRVQRLE